MRSWILFLCSVLISTMAPSAEVPTTAGFDFPLVSEGEAWVESQSFATPGPCADGSRTVFHPGADYDLPMTGPLGEPVFAAGDGVIRFSSDGYNNGYGTLIVIQHFGAFALPDDDGNDSGESVIDPRTAYAHLSSIEVNPELGRSWVEGDLVERGDLIGTVGGTGGYDPHLHLEVRILGREDHTFYPCGDEEHQVRKAYADPGAFIELNAAVGPPGSSVRYLEQGAPGGVGKDIWTTSVYCYCSGSGPGGGRDDGTLVVGGWGDLYWSLLQFDLDGLPPVAEEAYIEVFMYRTRSGIITPVRVTRATEDWEWRPDDERLWWADRPLTDLIADLGAPTLSEWFRIPVTDLYNAWQGGELENHGIVLKPSSSSNRWAEFYSSEHPEPALRPRLVVVPATIGGPS